MRFLLFCLLGVSATAGCGSSSSGGTGGPTCDDTPVPATAGATCNVAGTYTLTAIPRCNQDQCSEDADAPYDVTVTCAGNACEIDGSRTTGDSSTSFLAQCTLNGCACRAVGDQTFIFDANGFVSQGPSISYRSAGDGGAGSCSALVLFKGARK